MLHCGYELSRKAVEAQLCRSIRAESLTRACAEPRWRPRLARLVRQSLRTLAQRDRGRCKSESEASASSMEESIYTSHSRTLVPLTPSPSVTAALRGSLAALGGSAAMARVGLTPAATLFELNVLVSLPGDNQPTNLCTCNATQCLGEAATLRDPACNPIMHAGAAAQPAHVDQLPRSELAMGTLFLALQDTTAEMGATALLEP